MNQETELKIAIGDLAKFRNKLNGYQIKKHRHFEDNMVFDRKSELRNKSSVLRLRQAGQHWVMTFKGPQTLDQNGVKSRPEYESLVEDGASMKLIIESLGYSLAFRYQKYRTVFRAGDLDIMLDETPIGDFVELEGPIDQIERERAILGLTDQKGIAASYIELYLTQRKADDSPFMVFKS